MPNALRNTPPANEFWRGEEDWRIICDFDGTIVPLDVTDAILECFALPAWREIEDEWLAGHLTARDCMTRQVALLRTSRAELDAFLDTVPVDEGFPAFIRDCAASQRPVLVVSDGLDYAIRRILANHGLGGAPVIANRLVHCGEDRWRLDFPYGAADCPSGVCKCRVAESAPGRILLIGDGRSDCCLAGRADLVLAKRGLALAGRCVEADLPYFTYADFQEIRTLDGLWAAPDVDGPTLVQTTTSTTLTRPA